MMIKEMLNQHRRDFYAVYECEGCGHTYKSHGYDDRNFHDNVIPNMKCKECGKSSADLGTPTNFTPTVYPDSATV